MGPAGWERGKGLLSHCRDKGFNLLNTPPPIFFNILLEYSQSALGWLRGVDTYSSNIHCCCDFVFKSGI